LTAEIAVVTEPVAGEVESLAPVLAEQERLEEVRLRAMVAIARRLTRVAPKFVRQFLTGIWAYVVADAGAHGRTGADSWDARLELVDGLLWTVTTSSRPTSRA
jgi:hypothetical protein